MCSSGATTCCFTRSASGAVAEQFWPMLTNGTIQPMLTNGTTQIAFIIYYVILLMLTNGTIQSASIIIILLYQEIYALLCCTIGVYFRIMFCDTVDGDFRSPEILLTRTTCVPPRALPRPAIPYRLPPVQ